ncbi:cytochrome P450 [Spongiibacter sp. KMU-158]|uniref:Cytochrome P450 n=1 Tax=Spongiibacter pelagi TaxID=2760804 RepID=A0A927C1M8_9GAMM|nr:cytochrome P450 [Spongiibacter pelagi]MBD2857845.1 cytochrome P450 [Spongiibacter pelagi]
MNQPAKVQPNSYSPYSHEVHHDPYPWYKSLREQDPVHYNEEHGFWLFSKWEDCQNAFRDFKTYSSSKGVALEADQSANDGYPMFIFMDPPDHTRIRKLLSGLMVPQRIKRLEDYTREKAASLLDPLLAKGEMDVIKDFSAILPMDVISTLIHVPLEDQDTVRHWADDLIYREDGQFELSERNINAYLSLASYFDAHAKRMSERPFDPDDMYSCVLQAKKEGKMTHEDVIGFGILLAIAGNETTTKLIGNMAYRLWENPVQRQRLLDHPDRIADGVEETLRFDGSSQMIGRTLMRDVEVRGRKLREGDRVGLCIISASRDEERYDNADVYDVFRGARDHMAFGMGVHSCLGAALARLEVRVCFEELLKRIPHYELDLSRSTRAHNPNVRGFSSLPMSFNPV